FGFGQADRVAHTVREIADFVHSVHRKSAIATLAGVGIVDKPGASIDAIVLRIARGGRIRPRMIVDFARTNVSCDSLAYHRWLRSGRLRQIDELIDIPLLY